MATNRTIPIGIKDVNTGTTNSLSKLLQDRNFDYNITKYPLNLGGAGQGSSHYIIFHILEQKKSQYRSQNNPTGAEGATSFEKEKVRVQYATGQDIGQGIAQLKGDVGPLLTKLITPTTNSQEGKDGTPPPASPWNGTGVIGATGDVISGAYDVAKNDLPQFIDNATQLGFLRTVTKTAETIALYMPDTLNFIQPQGYADLEMGNNLITGLFAGGSAVADSIRAYTSGGTKEAFKSSLTRNLSPFLINALGDKLGNFGKAVVAAGQGMVTNPMIEVLYTSPGLRTFRFDFMFYPESQNEALAVQKIIQLFQFHQAPEIAPGTGGYFIIPPSEFDIEFYYNGYENINLPVISTCVLTSVDVDYAPNGWSAYEIPGQNATMGGSGMPVATKLSLEFKETSIVTKASRQFDKAPINKPTTSTPSINAATLRANLDKAAGK
jgi:hypothetical protein